MKNKTIFFKFVFFVKMLFFGSHLALGQNVLTDEDSKWEFTGSVERRGIDLVFPFNNQAEIYKARFNSNEITKEAKTVTFEVVVNEKGDDGGNFMAYFGHGAPQGDEVFGNMTYFGNIIIRGVDIQNALLNISGFGTSNASNGAIVSKTVTRIYPRGTEVDNTNSTTVPSYNTQRPLIWGRGYIKYRFEIKVQGYKHDYNRTEPAFNSYAGFGFRSSPGETGTRNSRWELTNVSVTVDENPEAMKPVVSSSDQRASTGKEVQICPCETIKYDLNEHTPKENYKGTYVYKWYKDSEATNLIGVGGSRLEVELKDSGQEIFYLKTFNGSEKRWSDTVAFTITKKNGSCEKVELHLPNDYLCVDDVTKPFEFPVTFKGKIGSVVKYKVVAIKATSFDSSGNIAGETTAQIGGVRTAVLKQDPADTKKGIAVETIKPEEFDNDLIQVLGGNPIVKIVVEKDNACNRKYVYSGIVNGVLQTSPEVDEINPQNAPNERNSYNRRLGYIHLFPEPDTSVEFYRNGAKVRDFSETNNSKQNTGVREIFENVCESQAPTHIFVNPNSQAPNRENRTFNRNHWIQVERILKKKNDGGVFVVESASTKNVVRQSLIPLLGGEPLTKGEYLLEMTFRKVGSADDNLGCPQTKNITIFVYETPKKPVITNQIYCEGATTPTLMATPEPATAKIVWYKEVGGQKVQLSATERPNQKNITYFAKAVLEYENSMGQKKECESEFSEGVQLQEIEKPAVPTIANKYYCAGTSAPALDAGTLPEGVTVKWYNSSQEVMTSAPNTAGTYYAKAFKTTNGVTCESDFTGEIKIEELEKPATPSTDTRYYCGTLQPVPTEDANGNELVWYASRLTGAQPITNFSTTGNYFVKAVKRHNGKNPSSCESAIVRVRVELLGNVAKPTGTSQTYCEGTTPPRLTATTTTAGATIKFYASNTGSPAEVTPNRAGTYYAKAVITSNGVTCESEFSDAITLTEIAKPTITVTNDVNNNACKDARVTFTVISSEADVKVYYTLAGNTETSQAIPAGQTSFTVSHTMTTTNATLTITKVEKGGCTFTIEASAQPSTTVTAKTLPAEPTVTIKDNKTKISVKKDGYYVITGTANSTVIYTIAGGSDQQGVLDGQGKLELKIPTETTGDKEIIITKVEHNGCKIEGLNVKASVKVVAASAYINPNLRLRVKQP